MSAAADFASGKGHKDENFPVASFILQPRHRGPILAFYRFARAADDVADHPSLPAATKLELLETMRAALAGESNASPEAAQLRRVLEQADLPAVHGLELLKAFRQDATQTRYKDWPELMDYCRWSAAPVGRFVLDVHAQSRTTWPASDTLCAALQVINHLQDCAKDYRNLDRIYLPLDELDAEGVGVDALARPGASPALRVVIRRLAERAQDLLEAASPLARSVTDGRLGYEIALIHRLARHLAAWLTRRDPIRQRVHHRPWEVAGLAALALGDQIAARVHGRP